jgi:hypothetical protein
MSIEALQALNFRRRRLHSAGPDQRRPVLHELVTGKIHFKGVSQIFESERQMNGGFCARSAARC